MEGVLGGIVVAVFCTILGLRFFRPRAVGAPAPPPATQQPDPVKRLYELAQPVYGAYQESAQPSDLLRHAGFMEAVTWLQRGPFRADDLLGYYRGDNALLACLAMEALARRDEPVDVRAEILAHISSVAAWTRFFALRALHSHTPTQDSTVGPLLLQAEGSWVENRHSFQFLKDFVATRVAAGEVPSFGERVHDIVEAQGAFLGHLLTNLGSPLADPLLQELAQWERSRIDIAYLSSVGRVWSADSGCEAEAVIEHEALRAHVLAVEAALCRAVPRSVLLVGESGVGKTAIVRALVPRLRQAGWLCFEAGEPELVAGQSMVGQLEERLLKLVKQVGGKRRVLWFVPNFHALMWAGRTMVSESNALDILLPHIDSGNIVVVGETRPLPFERLAVAKPRCASAVEIRRIEPLGNAATLDLARAWAKQHGRAADIALLAEETLREAQQLSQQYLGDQAAPGNLLRLLDLTAKRLAANEATESRPIGLDDLLGTLGELTGLPASMLDDRHTLELDGLRRHFDGRILGQPEAVDCLVERLAMLKAGVTDPGRPLGVFLFAGPTGTGKTAIAKALAEFLFGSPQRMIRLDMSELQTPDTMSRLLGSHDGRQDGALVDLIRKQPFSVVLLDEFEKAHPSVWDLFLQVFDDGRLTDRAGNTADFRHSIVIMTSNLGGLLPSGGGLGFGRSRDPFVPESVERVISQSFRPEFLNRIDRVVVFRPLGRDTMRDILRKELEAITRRRGLRNRSWAIEWSDDAVEFLLAKGFTADLGARPLKRAVERYLLTPLALAIVNHQFPEGDQFLFVRREGERLEVEFVDLEAAGDPAAAEAPIAADLEATSTPRPLERIALEPRGTAAELACVRAHYERLRGLVEDPGWQATKAALLAQTSSPAFWRSTERFSVLGAAEYRDRIEAGVRSAGSLLDRLLGTPLGGRSQSPPDLVGRLAEKLYLLSEACAGTHENQPHDAFVLVEAGRDRDETGLSGSEFARQITAMYRAWATKRRMQLVMLDESDGGGPRPYRALIAISGYAAYRILSPESGLHVYETPRPTDGFARSSVRVRVVPQPAEYAGDDRRALRRQAIESFRAEPTTGLGIVRRYRAKPRPWVRDRVRGWRSSRLDRILAGDFDLILDAPER